MKTYLLSFLALCVFHSSFGSTLKPNKKLNSKTKIINGSNSPALIYQVLLSTNPADLTGSYHGGGVLITPKCILTAKHVIAGGGSNLKAWVGINSRNQATSETAYSMAKRVNHPNNSIDVGLIFLDNAVPNVNSANPSIKLASENNSAWWSPGQSLTVSGFGIAATNTTNVSSDLKIVSVNTSTLTDPSSIICQGPNTSDACQGDSGGPLVKTGNNVLTGIVSADINGALPNPSNGAKNNCGLGGRYVKVSKVLDWIVEELFKQNTPEFICSNATTITTLPMMPDGCTIQWTTQVENGYPSNLFNVTSGTGLSFTVAAGNSTVQGFGRITLVFTSPGNAVKTVIKRVWVGSPPSTINVTTDGSFSLNNNNTSVCRTFGYCMTSSILRFIDPNTLTTVVNANASSISNFSYSGSFPSANGNNAFFTLSTISVANDRACFESNITNTYAVNIITNNTCGVKNRQLFITVNNCGARIFPNPASNVVKIEFENPDKLESIPDLIELYDERKQKKSKSMDISKNKKGLIEMDVSDLPRGTYYLKMTYEKKSEIETIRIILE